jgi:nucleotide-binding universal stress UspA family protein
MMKKILIALDYDPTAQKVAEAGFALAGSMNAEITLLHVISDPVYYSSVEYSPVMGFTGYMEMGQLQTVSIARLKEATLQYLEKIKQHLRDESITTIVTEGDFAESILDTAKDLNSDLIVMGTHSRKWLENILMGSVAEKVLRQSTIPLFIIPTKKT